MAHKTIKALRTLKSLNKDYYTIADLEKIFALSRGSLFVTLSRLQKAGEIIRLRKGLYQLPKAPIKWERIASGIYQPSYISFETALAKYGILSQIPYALTLATTNRPKKIITQGRLIEYRRLKKELFFGFSLEDSVYLASPEKALLDELYFVSKGRATLDLDELDLGEIGRKKFLELTKTYPPVVQKLARKIFVRGEI